MKVNYNLCNRLNGASRWQWPANKREQNIEFQRPDRSPWALIDNILLATQAASKWLLASRYSFFPYDRQLARIVIASSFARSHYALSVFFPLLLPSIGPARRRSRSRSFSPSFSRPSSLHPRSVNFSFSQENKWRGLPVIGPLVQRAFGSFSFVAHSVVGIFGRFPTWRIPNMGENYRTFFFVLRAR